MSNAKPVDQASAKSYAPAMCGLLTINCWHFASGLDRCREGDWTDPTPSHLWKSSCTRFVESQSVMWTASRRDPLRIVFCSSISRTAGGWLVPKPLCQCRCLTESTTARRHAHTNIGATVLKKSSLAQIPIFTVSRSNWDEFVSESPRKLRAQDCQTDCADPMCEWKQLVKATMRICCCPVVMHRWFIFGVFLTVAQVQANGAMPTAEMWAALWYATGQGFRRGLLEKCRLNYLPPCRVTCHGESLLHTTLQYMLHDGRMW